MPGNMRFFTSEFPAHLQCWLGYWAFALRKQSLGAMVRDVCLARVESNRNVIQWHLEEMARVYGLSIEELQQEIDAVTFDPKSNYIALHKRLLEKAKQRGKSTLIPDPEDD